MTGYVTTKRVAAIRNQLTRSDWTLLHNLDVTKLLSGRQLRQLQNAHTGTERRRLRADLRRLTELRVLARLNRRVGGVRAGSDSFVYTIDVVGQRLIDPSPRRQWRKPWTPGVRILVHALAVSDLYVNLVHADRDGLLELLSFASEPRCWRSFVGPGGARMVLKPDAHLIVGVGETELHAWIEVDRSTESLAWITEKAKAYHRYFLTGREQEQSGVFPRALWLAPDPKRASQLAEALSRLPAEHWQLHQVTTADQALAVLTGNIVNLSGEPRS
jgi:hypothetical protein